MLAACALLLTLFSSVARAGFSFTTNQPTLCQKLSVSWTGGQPPFSLSIYPAFGTPETVSIPNTAFSNGEGTFSTGFPLNPNSSSIVTLMSDATGWASGGISPVIPIGKDNGNCNVPDPSPDFFWDSSFALQQCRPYELSIQSNATYPVTITVLVPGGTSQNFTTSQASFTIPTLSIPAGSQVLMTLTDAQQRTGGNSDITPVVQTGDTSCLTGSFPSSTYVPPSTSATKTTAAAAKKTSKAPASSVSSSSAASKSQSPASDSRLSGGVIAGVIAAIVITVIAIVAFVLFYRKHRQQTSRYGRRRHDVDLDSPTLHPVSSGYVPEPFTLTAPNPFEPELYGASPNSSTAFIHNAGTQAGDDVQNSRIQSQYTQSSYVPSQYTQSQYGPSPYAPSQYTHTPRQSIATMTGSAVPTTRSSKIAAVREQAARRYVLHTDVADEPDDAEGEEVIELPPQYSENRRPIPGIQPYKPDTLTLAGKR